jgi:hypothetical protein
MRRPVLPGVEQMIKKLAACVTLMILLTIGSNVSAADLTAADLKIDSIKQALELQLERIRAARERAENQMSLAKMRIAERLRLSSEELTRQLEILQRLQEQLSAGTGDSQQAFDQFRNDFAQLLATATAEINSQVSQTNDLIRQMETLRDNFENSPSSASTSASQWPQTSATSAGSYPSQTPTVTGISPVDTPAPTAIAPTTLSPAPTEIPPTTTAPTTLSPTPTAPTTGST